MSKSISEIAMDTGFSVTTVKFVINGKADKYRISKKTQSVIQDYILEHGYTVNQTARSLKLNKTNTIGLIIPWLSNPFFSQLTEKLQTKCQEEDLQLLVVSSFGEPSQEYDLLQTLLARGVDALFWVASSRENQLKAIKANSNKPIIFIDQTFTQDNVIIVHSDNYSGSYQLTKRVLDLTISESFYICGDTNFPSIQARLKGFVNAHHDANRELHHSWNRIVNKNTHQDGYHAFKSLYEEINRVPEGLIFSSIPLMEGSLHYMKEQLGAIPRTTIIGTFDDHTMLDFLPNRVLSVRQNVDDIAYHSMHKLLQIVKQKKLAYENIIVDPIIVDRK
ncbi:substrate-binding domain-containing protein [Photobacterium sp. DNB23_23_1]